MHADYKNSITIIGGGLAGLTSAILLSRWGFDVTVIERKEYPFHRVCGEYVSNEALPFLKSIGINFNNIGVSNIRRLAVSAVNGKTFKANLDLGGFGISRFEFDNLLYHKALEHGVNFIFDKATDIQFQDNSFFVTLSDKKIQTDLVIATHGKRSNIDQKLNRTFFQNRSPYMGVKYHIKTDFPDDLIQLDNFQGGYCGIEKIENDTFCLCYLSENSQLKRYGNIPEMEKNTLYKNPFLKHIFENSDFLFDKPEVINEVSFEQKSLVENHILFCGDSAGMITPLCGNGMAMAIHAAKIVSETVMLNHQFTTIASRLKLEKEYQLRWKNQFAFRLKSGRLIQKLFGNPVVSNLAISSLNTFPSVGNFLIKKTHGKTF